MITDSFDFAVIGDQAAGIWLLEWLADLKKSNALAPQRLLWIRASATAPKFLLPKAAYENLFFPNPLELGPSDSFEIVSSERTFSWNHETVQTLYPSLFVENPIRSRIRPSAPMLSAIRYTLRHQPKLLTYATAIWKAMGRAPRLNPENTIWAALLSLEIKEWQPSLETLKAMGVTVVETSTLPKIQRMTRTKQNIEFDLGEIHFAKRWLINLSWQDLQTFCSEQPSLFNSLSSLHVSPLALQTQYRLTLELTTPKAKAKRAILLDTDEIPEFNQEILPVFLSRNGETATAELWASAETATSLDRVGDAFRRAYGQFGSHFPGLAKEIKSISPALDPDSCLTPSRREELLREYEASALEIFGNCQTEFRTPTPGIFHVSPAFGAYLPYPLGPLLGTKAVLRDFLHRKCRDKLITRHSGKSLENTR